MTAAEIWLTIAGLTAVTIVTRNVFLVLGHRVTLPERVQHALRYAPACALVALIAPELLLTPGTFVVDLVNPKLAASIATIAILLLTRRAVLAIVAGMLAFTLLRLL
ncbi:MAG TPA: AzlD domain-containing protein [Burkholderiaceae bacterium]|nr:AzlD domain-containing protein [Burkholderiaceae bacterium]